MSKSIDVRKIISPHEFKDYVQQLPDKTHHQLKAGTVLAREITAQAGIVGNPDDRVMQFIASSGEVDRYGDTIDPAGWDLKHYNDKGLFLWAHNMDATNPPLGNGVKAFVENDLLHIQIKWLEPDFADHDWVKFANMLYRMYEQGIMKDVSIGMLPLEWQEADRKEFFMPFDFTKQELLELSAVPIGANREVGREEVGKEFLEARQAGIDVAPAVLWAEEHLDEHGQDDTVLEIYRKLKAEPVQVPEDIRPGPEPQSNEQIKELKDQVDQLERTVQDLAIMVQTMGQSDTCCGEGEPDLSERVERIGRKAVSALREVMNEEWKVPLDGRLE